MADRTRLYSYVQTGEEEVTDQQAGKKQPPLFQYRNGEPVISLSRETEHEVKKRDVCEVLRDRRSRRLYGKDPLTKDELSFLLQMTQGVKRVTGNAHQVSERYVPSAGARHALETYVVVQSVEGMEPGIYHYLALEHALEYCKTEPQLMARVSAAFCGQTYFASSAVQLIWTAIPYRMEWRYGSFAEKLILLDAGHVCQNLYLAAEALEIGVCAVAAYEQELADELLGLTETTGTEEEHVVYAACVGTLDKE